MLKNEFLKAILLVSAFCFASCDREAFLLDDGPITQEGRELTFTASMDKGPLTRTQKADGSDDVLWSPKESINIFYGSSGSCFQSNNTEPAATVSFSGTLSSFTGTTSTGEPLQFWSVYPYHRENTYSNSAVSAVLPSTQTCSVGNFPDKTRLMVAKSSGLALSFRQVCSMLRVNIPASIDDITRITLQGNNDEILAGRVSVSFDSNDIPEWTAIEAEGDKVITILPSGSATFAAGNYYIPLLPQTLESGFTITYYRTGTYGSKTTSSAALFERNKTSLATSAVQVKTWTPLEHPSNEIWYTTSDGCTAQYYENADYADEIEIVAPGDNGIGIVRFPSAVKTIPTYAFNASLAGNNNRKITSVILPETVETIGEGAFANCEALTSIQMDGVKYILKSAFYSCGFETLSLHEGLVGISSHAFQWCHNLRSVQIPESVITLGYPFYFYENPFESCPALESFSGKFATDDGRALLSGNGAGYRDVLVAFAAGAMEGGTYTVPDGVLSIAARAFNHAKLAEVDLNEVTYLFEYAFSDSDLKRIHIPSTVTGLGAYALANCPDLEYIRIDVTTSLPSIGTGVFDGSTCPIYVPAAWLQVFKTADRWSAYADRYQALPSANEIVYFAGNQLTGSNNTYLGHFLNSATSHTFENGRGVLTFASPVTVLPRGAFEDAPITGVILPDGITQIREIAFRGCDQLTSVTLPSSLQYLGTSAFESSGLTSVTIPNSVEHIGTIWDNSTGAPTDHDYNPFLGCSNLVSFSGKFATPDGLFLVDNGYLVSGAIGAPALGEGQGCVIPSTVTTVGQYALAYGQFTYLSCVNAQVLDINCFYGCSNLSFFEMGYNVREIRSEAFAMPNGMTGSLAMVNFMLMNDLPEITTDAFKNQNYVELWISGWQATDSAAAMGETWGASPVKEHVRVHQHRDEIWVHFDGTGTITGDFLTDIQNKFLRKDGTVIGLYGYAPLATKFTVIPKSVFPAGIDGSGVYVLKYNGTIQRLAANAFSATGNTLDYISLPNEVTSIGAGAFEGLGLLKKFPGADNDSFYPLNYLTSIGENAFNGCVSMAGSVPMPDVTSLGADAFKNCKALTSVTLGPVSSIPSGAFYECNALQSVTLDTENLTTIGSEAFYRCKALSKLAPADMAVGRVYLPKVTSVGSFAFLSNYRIKILDLGQSVTSTTLETAAFDACSGLQTVNMPNVSEVPQSCFFSCSSLNSINAPLITSIGKQGFYGCSSLKSLVFPYIETIGDKAFGRTRNLTTLDLGENLESFGKEVFYDEEPSLRNMNILTIYLRGTKWYYNEGNSSSNNNWNIYEAFNYKMDETNAYFQFKYMYVLSDISADFQQGVQYTFGTGDYIQDL